jgi:hypothetical protein
MSRDIDGARRPREPARDLAQQEVTQQLDAQRDVAQGRADEVDRLAPKAVAG